MLLAVHPSGSRCCGVRVHMPYLKPLRRSENAYKQCVVGVPTMVLSETLTLVRPYSLLGLSEGA
jgi:hypothetical protein